MRTVTVRSQTHGTLTSNCLLKSLSMESFEDCTQDPAVKIAPYAVVKHFCYSPVWSSMVACLGKETGRRRATRRNPLRMQS